MASISEVLGVCTPFDRKNRDGEIQEYCLASIQPHHRAMFEAWLRKQAWECIEQAKQWVNDETTRTSISVLTQDIAAKRYSMGSRNYDDASRAREGVRYLMMLMLRENHKDVDEEWVEKWLADDPVKAVWHYNEALGVKQTETKADGPAG